MVEYLGANLHVWQSCLARKAKIRTSRKTATELWPQGYFSVTALTFNLDARIKVDPFNLTIEGHF